MYSQKNTFAQLSNFLNGLFFLYIYRVKWDNKEIRTQHSVYVDMLSQEFTILKGRFDAMGEYVEFILGRASSAFKKKMYILFNLYYYVVVCKN